MRRCASVCAVGNCDSRYATNSSAYTAPSLTFGGYANAEPFAGDIGTKRWAICAPDGLDGHGPVSSAATQPAIGTVMMMLAPALVDVVTACFIGRPAVVLALM